jgi:hypothetical protein
VFFTDSGLPVCASTLTGPARRLDALEAGLGLGVVLLGLDGRARHAVERGHERGVFGRHVAVAHFRTLGIARDEPEAGVALLQAQELGGRHHDQLAGGVAGQRALDHRDGLLPGLVDHAAQHPRQADEAAQHQRADHHLQQDQAPDEAPAQREQAQAHASRRRCADAAQMR